MTKHRILRWAPLLVAVLLAQMAIAMLLTASNDSPTVDEPAHIAAGILNVREHDLRWNAEHPPLIKVFAGLATLGEDIPIPRGADAYRNGDEYTMGRALLYGPGADPHRIVWRARLPIIALTLAFGVVVFGFARELFGTAGGVVALAFYTLCPTVLAHGRIVHTDVALGGFLLTTTWFLWRAEKRGIGWLVAGGLCFGLALASKFTALFALPVVGLLAFWAGFASSGRHVVMRLARGATYGVMVVVLALGVLWGVYLATSPSLRFDTHFYDRWANRAGGLSADVIDGLPVPEAYRVGLRFATAFDQSGERRAFLFGELYTGGRWTFYPAMLVAKTPLGALPAWAGGIVILAIRKRKDALRSLLALPVVFLVLAMLSSTNIGVRHIVVIPMFGAVIAGGLATVRRTVPLAILLITLTATSVWWRAYPSPIPYVNEAFGTPSNAHERFTDANVDWGQDLFRLGEYIRRQPANRPEWIFYYGAADPAAYGVDARDATKVPRADVHGLVAISTSWLSLYPDRYGWVRTDGDLVAQPADSILIYRLP